VHQAALMSRKRGRIVLVGVTGLELSRADFFEKELSFQVSCSYGPGRYDANYEEKGQDYPVGFVRWTEQRNFEAVLDMLAEGRLELSSLISHRFAIEEAELAYAVVGGTEPSLGILLTYPDATPENLAQRRARTVRLAEGEASSALVTQPAISVIGSGNYAGAVLVPAFRAAGAQLRRIASSGGASSVHLGRKFGFAEATTDTEALLADPRADAIVIATRHDTHAEFVLRALAAGKHVFVEKPLALTQDELTRIETAAQAAPQLRLMVGFNRRFAPQVQRMRQLLAARPGPKTFVMTVNAGAIPASHWTQDPLIGGGRLLGEGCHFIDLLRFLSGAPVRSWEAVGMDSATKDTATVMLRFSDGSLATVHYLANGSKAFPKERLEVFAGGGVLQLDNFRRLAGFGWPGFTKMNLWRQDKGQNACAAAFIDAIRTGAPSPIPLAELIEVGRLSVQIEEALR
jgi:predicted dehydrogenase